MKIAVDGDTSAAMVYVANAARTSEVGSRKYTRVTPRYCNAPYTPLFARVAKILIVEPILVYSGVRANMGE